MPKSGSKKRKGAKPAPLAPPMMKSRKRARKVTTLFHKYTRERDAAQEHDDTARVECLDRLIQEMGGREEYQRASQVSTSFHSTSKWVLGVLSRNGWLHGRVEETESVSAAATNSRKLPRRDTTCLEVGAINTELLDASARSTTDEETGVEMRKYRLRVRAIDLNSMHPDRIEEADFLTISLSPDREDRYDVIVCSMVLNCVTTPEKRGNMVTRLFHFLRPGGLCFVTIPRLCLSLSPYMDQQRFRAVLEAVGFEVTETKESPKIAFFICRRPSSACPEELDSKWMALATIRRGRKYRNDFSVVLNTEAVTGHKV